MAAPSLSEITGLVLAGGRGSRMGGADKGWVVHDGVPLVTSVVQRLAPQVASLVISANRNLDGYRRLAEVVTDNEAPIALEPFPGPLAGVLAGLARASTPWVALAPCDAPALPADLVARLASAVGESDAGCPVAGGRRQPVFALVRRSAEESLRAYLQRGGRSMRGWFDTLHVIDVPFVDADAFRNINEFASPADAAERDRTPRSTRR